MHGSPSKAAASAASWANGGMNNDGAGGCWLSPGLLEEGPGSAASWEQECLERACWEGPVSHFLGRSALAAAPGSPRLKVSLTRWTPPGGQLRGRVEESAGAGQWLRHNLWVLH